MGIGQEILWLIAGLSLLLSMFVAVANGLQRNSILVQKVEMQKTEIELRKLILDQTTTFSTVVSAARSASELEMRRLIQELHDAQIFNRDHFARRDSFYEVIGEVKETVKEAVTEVKLDVARIEKNIDKRLEQFEERLNKV